jgi:hypothetical protein
VPFDDFFNYRQANARTGELALAVKALEHAEQLANVFLIEAGAMIPDRVDDTAVFDKAAHFDLGHRTAHGIFDSV